MIAFYCVVVVAVLLLSFRTDYEYRRGVRDGYKLGRGDADNWWLRAEQDVDQARKIIWREESML
jgi:hypothetical protein